MNHAEFARMIAFAFHLVAEGSTVKVEPYCCELPIHPKGRATAVMTMWQGPDRWLVAYDPKLMGRGSRRWWLETAFHEACHVGLDAFGRTRGEALEAERRVDDCAEKWMREMERRRR